METEYLASIFLNNLDIVFHPITVSVVVAVIVTTLLLFSSALLSGSEVAFFSLSPKQLKILKKKASLGNMRVIKLLEMPERLLATMLTVNNFIYVGIVILSSFIFDSLIDFSNAPALGFVFQVVIITFFLLFFGEIIPKVYATQHASRFSVFMAYPLYYLEKIFRPISNILIKSTSIVNKRLSKKQNISMDDLSQALELTAEEISDEKDILEGIVKFGNIDVEKIMKSRVDVVSVDINANFNKLKSVIIESGYSRIPVYSKTFDSIRGVLYIKDLLPYVSKSGTFRWQSLIRPPYFVPETKKINDLLKEFQTKKNHMAIVVDEYGGTSGIITMEDILEEIVGDISDESDEEQFVYSLENDGSYIFEGKTLLNDFFKIVGVDDNVFDKVKGDADTLAGLILEMKGAIPEKHEKFAYESYKFTIEAVDNRRIKKIRFKVTQLKDSSGSI